MMMSSNGATESSSSLSLSSSTTSHQQQQQMMTSELKGIPPEFWHAQRRANSQNVIKKGFTDLILSQ